MQVQRGIRLFLASLALSAAAAGAAGCVTTYTPTALDRALAAAPVGSYATGTVQRLGPPNVLNRADFIYALDYSADGKTLAFSHHVTTDMELTVTGLDPLTPRFQVPVGPNEFDVEDVAVGEGDSAGLVFAVSRQGVWRSFDAETGMVVKTVTDGAALLRATLSADGALLAVGAADGRVAVYEARTGALVASVFAHDGPVTGVAFLDEAHVMSVGADATAQVHRLSAHDGKAASVPAADHAGRAVFLAQLGVRPISATLDRRLAATVVHSRAVKRLKLTATGAETTIATPFGEERAPVYMLPALSLGPVVLGDVPVALCDACFDHPGELAFGQDLDARVKARFDLAAGRVVLRPAAAQLPLAAHARQLRPAGSATLPGPAGDLSAARDGRTLAIAYSHVPIERSAALYAEERKGNYPKPTSKSAAVVATAKRDGEAWTITLSAPFVAHEGFTVTAALSPDGQTLASGGWDKRVVVFDVKSGAIITERGFASLVRRVRFAPNGQTLAVGAFTPPQVQTQNGDPALVFFPLIREAGAVVRP